MVPILVFIVVLFFALDPGVFADNCPGYDDLGSLDEQVKHDARHHFVFLGIEGASVYSRHAKRREDVGRATVLGFLMVFAVFASVTLSSYCGDAAATRSPSSASPRWAACFEAADGEWGKVFISVAVIISVLGAYLAWTLMAAEVLFVAARTRTCRCSWAR